MRCRSVSLRPPFFTTPEPTAAAVLDSRTLRSTPEGGHHARYDGAKRKQGSKVHATVDTLGHLLALRVTPATEQDRAQQVDELTRSVQEATGESVELAYVDRDHAGEQPAAEAEAHGIRLEVVEHPGAKKGFVLLPRTWVVERSFVCASRFRRLAKGYERPPGTVAGLPSSPSPASSSTGCRGAWAKSITRSRERVQDMREKQFLLEASLERAFR